jgi:hypothetical protein
MDVKKIKSNQLVNALPSGSSSLLVMERFFKRGQTYHGRENRERAVKRYLTSGQTFPSQFPSILYRDRSGLV